MTKADSPKPPPKLESITLKVFIHCEGCRRKVRRIIRVVDGVEDVTVDSASGKVTVSGTADVKTILQRLQKYGKHAEMWPSSNPVPAAPAKAGGNQPKPSNNGSDNNSKKKGNGAGDKAPATAENESKKGGVKEEATSTPAKGEDTAAASEKKPEKSKEGNSVEASDASTPPQSGGNSGGGGGGGKKGGKKGGNGNSNNGNSGVNAPPEPPSYIPVHDLPIISAPNTSVTVSANKSLSPYDSIQTGYSYHSAEYATHMFSDENANNCSIM